MNELIRINNQKIGDGFVQTVNARDLHAFLGVGQDFSTWIKRQIERARLVENRDFVSFTQKGERAIGGTTRVEYHLTIEAAKHIAMMSGCDKGFEVRDYFLECERVAKQQPNALNILNDPVMLRAALLTYSEDVIRLEAIVAEQLPKVEALDRISMADGLLCLTDAAKTLGIRRKDLISWMSAHRWIYRRPGNGSWIAYQDRLQQGVLDHKIEIVPRGDGVERVREQVKVTAKGLSRLAEILATAPA